MENFTFCAVWVTFLFLELKIFDTVSQKNLKDSSFFCFDDLACLILRIACVLKDLVVSRKTTSNKPHEIF